MKKHILLLLACVVFATTACQKETAEIETSTDTVTEVVAEVVTEAVTEETAEDVTEETAESILVMEPPEKELVVTAEPRYQCKEQEFNPLPDVVANSIICTNYDDITSIVTTFAQPDGIAFVLEGTQVSGVVYDLVIAKSDGEDVFTLDAECYPKENGLVGYPDLNFDGFVDLQVQMGSGTKNCSYDLYVYVPELQTFQKANAEEIISSSIEAKEDGTVISFGQNSASDGVIDTYVWDGYDLVLDMEETYGQ
ncbi:XAC2610-related protein [Chakrabartyella piscis]|uniref:XAC2610-related protein n=1 Tax=Chakrabartyella piscis TaxID=2918914 RepID=UPI002958C6FE|nr:hypothetical protein [Chakrabartyella piscis]